MRVLTVSPFPVMPLSHGGRARAWGLATGLAAAGAEVDILLPWQPGRPIRRFTRDGVTCHPYLLPANALPLAVPERIVPSLVSLSCSPALVGYGRLTRRFSHYDAVQLEFCARADRIPRTSGGPKIVYSAHNVERDYAISELGTRERMVQRLERLEQAAVSASDLVVTCTRADADRLECLYGSPRAVEVIPNGSFETLEVANHRERRSAARRSFELYETDTVLVFIGGSAPHNREAARFLENTLLPGLDVRATLLLGGNCAPEGPPRAGVRRLGFVPDLGPLLAAADIALSPVTHGSGQSVKIFDYLASGLPVVTTPFGIRGVRAPEARLRVTGREGFAEAIRELARLPGPVEMHPSVDLSWKARGRLLHSRLTELVSS